MSKADPHSKYRLLSKFYFFTHQFFQNQDFVYLKTPSLVICPGTEPSLEVFQTELKLESKSKFLFLATSPELHLKKALTQGFTKIYEITTSYRNGEITDRHQPEFQILEWYRTHSTLADIKKDFADMITYLAQNLKSLNHTSSQLRIHQPAQIYSVTIAELFKQHLNFNLQPQTHFSELAELSQSLGYKTHPKDTIDDLFFWLMTTHIEPNLNPDDLVFVEDYPPYQAALATLSDSGWAQRFEAYWQGYELCNAFQELNDESIQRARAEEDLQKKIFLNKTPIPLDEDFLACVSQLPPSAGVAVGLERVFMCLLGLSSISDCTLFPHKIESLEKK